MGQRGMGAVCLEIEWARVARAERVSERKPQEAGRAVTQHQTTSAGYLGGAGTRLAFGSPGCCERARDQVWLYWWATKR